jgi:UDP-N-acetylglucosamine 1-carboxyvinyltransferase
MDKLLIAGGVPLRGEVQASGAKNSALPALAACLLTSEPVTLRGIPRVKDIATMEKLLAHTGAEVYQEDGTVRVHAASLDRPGAPYEIVKTMRASSLVLGPLVARARRARVSLPGGCAIGARPINYHLSGLERLGATIQQEHGYIEVQAPNGLTGNVITFDRISVTGTEDLLMAAVLAEGETIIENAAREPEVVDLVDLLTKMGASIEGAGTSTIRVRGVSRVSGADHAIIPDRIEVGTFLIGAAITGGDVTVSNTVAGHLQALLGKLRQCGVEVSEPAPGKLRAASTGQLRSVDVTTEEHPGFPTDLQAQFMALMTQSEGISIITETIFENRFMHVLELVRMGANVRVDGRQAIVAGPRKLSGAQVIASDLRASASLVLAGLIAEGETIVDRVYHLDRGYEAIDTKLTSLGARVRRLESK